MIEAIFVWLAAIIYVEAVVEILVTSELFFPVRDYIGRKGGLLATLVTCGYCMSMWIAMTVGWALPGVITGVLAADIAIKTFVVHRLSNVFHSIIIRRMNKEPFEMVIFNESQASQ